MTTGVAPPFALAAMIAPRRLQSLGAPVQVDAATASSVRSTVKVVAIGIIRPRASGAVRETASGWLNEIEDAPTKATSVNNAERTRFIVVLQCGIECGACQV